MINHPALILYGILLETCQGPQGVPFFAFCQPLSLASCVMISYQLPYPECFNNAIMIIIDALPIIHLQYSGKQCLWKYATAAPRSHSCVVFIFTLKQTAPEELCSFNRRDSVARRSVSNERLRVRMRSL